MGHLNKAGTSRHRAGQNFIHTEQIKSNGGPHDINDGINGPDFMEVDFLDRHAVTIRFSLTQLTKNTLGQCLLAVGQNRAVDDGIYVVQVAVHMLVGGIHIGISGAHAAAFDGLKLHSTGQAEAGNGLGDRFATHAGVYQSTQSHIARDTAGAVKISHSHRRMPAFLRVLYGSLP